MGFKVYFCLPRSRVLVQDFPFLGYVMSDWGATHDSAADNANAGLDMEQPGDYIIIGGSTMHSIACTPQ